MGETGLDYFRLPSSQGGKPGRMMPGIKPGRRTYFSNNSRWRPELGLNCVIHQRASFDDTLAQLKKFPGGRTRGVSCFGESVAGIIEVFEIGALVSYTGIVTFKNGQNIQDAVAATPMDRFMLETGALFGTGTASANPSPGSNQVLEIGALVSYTGIVTFKNGQNIRDAVAATPMDRFMLETDCPYLAPVPHRGKRCEPPRLSGEISETVAQVKKCSVEELSQATCRTAAAFFPKLT